MIATCFILVSIDSPYVGRAIFLFWPDLYYYPPQLTIVPKSSGVRKGRRVTPFRYFVELNYADIFFFCALLRLYVGYSFNVLEMMLSLILFAKRALVQRFKEAFFFEFVDDAFVDEAIGVDWMRCPCRVPVVSIPTLSPVPCGRPAVEGKGVAVHVVVVFRRLAIDAQMFR